MPYSIFIVNSSPGCSLPDDCSVISDVVTNLKSFHATGGPWKKLVVNAALCPKAAEAAQGDTGNLIFLCTPRSGYSVMNRYTCPVKKKKRKGGKKHQCQPEIGNSGTRKKNLWTHKATKEAGIFLFTVSIFYTHIYLYKGFMPFPVCPYDW